MRPIELLSKREMNGEMEKNSHGEHGAREMLGGPTAACTGGGGGGSHIHVLNCIHASSKGLYQLGLGRSSMLVVVICWHNPDN